MTHRVSFDSLELDVELIHAFLSGAYWSQGISRDVVERAIKGSLCVGSFAPDETGKDEQIGFARVVTDRATFAYLADVFVIPAHRGAGVAKAMVQALQDHPELQGLRRWMLATSDAHGVYEALGWQPLAQPELFMQRHDPDVYRRGTA
ncbi:GNAT family N-acetyltransferase [Sphingomonas koreensis]